jgi:hypothetical protein
MNTVDERKQLEALVSKRPKARNSEIPLKLRQRLDSWSWGTTGWTSPTNLIVTAAWRKAFYPKEDCCKIWARDALNNPIAGGYSIRTADETVTVPIFSKYSLTTGFCSSNSGMQGSRAIEKSRAFGRINRGVELEQRTVFNFTLFADILNDINDLSQSKAYAALSYIIDIAYRSKDERTKSDKMIMDISPNIDLIDFSIVVKDPEFIKCVTAACFAALFLDAGFEITGVADHKTAADGRAAKPGDLTVARDGKPMIAIEVKDRSRKLDWQNLSSARQIIGKFPRLDTFCFVLESRKSAHDALIEEFASDADSGGDQSTKIMFISLPDLIGLATPMKGHRYLVTKTAEYVASAPSIKPSTKDAWVQLSSDKRIGKG